MAEIRAVVVDPEAPGRLALATVDGPVPLPSEALVQVVTVSLNRGEVRRVSQAAAGWRPGWDIAGTVEAPAADGSGPTAGTRVVGTLPAAAWAEVVAVPTRALAELPNEVSFAQAATLPIAGLTALVALEKYGGLLLGRNVLITGASGGVGHFAVQLAKASGARVVGLVRQARSEALVREAGADEVAIGEDATPAAPFGPYDHVVDSIGGATLGTALGLLAPDGVAVNFGPTGGTTTPLDVPRFYGTGGLRLHGLIIFHELERRPAGAGLARLVRLVADGRLRPHVEVEAPWTEIGEVAQRLQDRAYTGKAVLHVGP